MIQIETLVVPFPRDGSPAVLLQLPDSYAILKPEDARLIARQLTETAEEAEAKSDG